MILGPPGGIIELQLGADDDDDGSLHRKDSPGADAQKNQDDTRSPSVNGSSQGAGAEFTPFPHARCVSAFT
jgi:hypothetical protein